MSDLQQIARDITSAVEPLDIESEHEVPDNVVLSNLAEDVLTVDPEDRQEVHDIKEDMQW